MYNKGLLRSVQSWPQSEFLFCILDIYQWHTRVCVESKSCFSGGFYLRLMPDFGVVLKMLLY